MQIRSRNATVTRALAIAASAGLASAASAQFFHFESPHVHPLELTPDGARLLAVNTVDARLEVFDVLGKAPYLRHAGSVAVGIEPVSVRARSSTEAWVVNHVSDSISVVDLATLSVKTTVLTGDEPCDVVFAGTSQRAFVTVSQLNRVEVFNPRNLAAAPTIVNIAGEDPRALATDGLRVYAAIFESGNDTTIIPESVVSSTVNPYAGDPNPPPNSGSSFSPAITAGLPTAPRTGMIVRKNSAGQWLDNNGGNWSAAVTWNLSGNDIAVIDANTLGTTYAKGFMTTPLAMTVGPDGKLLVVGTEARNEIRFEPKLNGVFARVEGAQLIAGAAGTRAYAAGMGSSNIVSFALPGFARTGLTAVGEGPTGLVLDAPRARLYTLNRFAGSISVVDESAFAPLGEVGFFDPTPNVVRNGRPILYDTHISSGLGQVSCGTCHVDARMDQLAWDLGDPSGQMKTFNESCNGIPGGIGQCNDWHPMKGPLTTQTLIGLAGNEPFHWRGDRNNFGQFAHTTVALMGADADFSATEMARMEAYLATISFPPNPNRNLNGSLKTSLAGGNPVTGQTLFNTGNLDVVNCVVCHTVPTGGSSQIISGNLLLKSQAMKVPHLRNLLEKTGFDKLSSANNRGFGFSSDGNFATLFDFFKLPVFNFASGATGDQQRRDVSAFMLSWDTGTHASVGAQASLGGTAPTGAARRDQLVTIAQAGNAQLVAKTAVDGIERGFLRSGTAWQSDVSGETWTTAQIDALATASRSVVFTLVPNGSGGRWLDRDGDGYRDGDERASCSDPNDPASIPGGGCRADLNGDAVVNGADLAGLLASWGMAGGAAAGDLDCDGVIGATDLAELLNSWGACP